MAKEVTLKNVREHLTEAQKIEYKEAFAIFDKNGDGSISRDELKVVLDALGTNTTEENLDKLIMEVDMDNNGEIDYDEFLLMMYRQAQGVSSNKEAEVRKAFSIFERDGWVKTGDLIKVLCSLGDSPTNPTDLDELLTNVEKTPDGLVKFDDLVRVLSM